MPKYMMSMGEIVSAPIEKANTSFSPSLVLSSLQVDWMAHILQKFGSFSQLTNKPVPPRIPLQTHPKLIFD